MKRSARYAAAKAEAMASFAAFTRGEVDAPRFPLEIFLEVSNLCNARCVMCTVFSALNPDRLDEIHADGRSHMLQVDQILEDEALFSHALNVHLFGFGEPTIHPRFQELVRKVGRYEVVIDFFTNGMKLQDDGLIDTLIEAKVERLTLSFSGSTKEAYENVYQGCSWETVLGGLRKLAEKKRAAGSRYPTVHVNSLAWAHHLDSLEQFVLLMAEHGASTIEVKQLVPYEHIPELAPHVGRTRTAADLERLQRAKDAAQRTGVNLYLQHGLDRISDETAPAQGGFVPIDRLLERAAHVELRRTRPDVRSKLRIPADATLEQARAQLEPDLVKHGFHCMEPFKTLYVRQGGLTKPCCFMKDNSPALGDVSEQPALDVWRGNGHRALREGALASVYPETGCDNCILYADGPPTHFASWLFGRYGSWYADTFGEPLDAAPGAIVPDGSTIAALITSRREAEAAGGQAPIVEGYLDHAGSRSISGWAWAPEQPALRVPIWVWSNGRRIAKIVAMEHRPDVQAAGRGDGRYGFSLVLPEGEALDAGDIVSVTAASDDQPLGHSPKRVAESRNGV